jgi:seryl-tRNA synthetase
MDSASKEILGMLFDEGKDHIDEEQKKQEEQAEALKEKKEEQEELIEKRKEDREEAEELTEEIIQGTDDVSGKTLSEVQQELKEILDKMKLIDEDIKGAQVDEVL